METKDIRIFIVDDHSLFRQGLARLLESEPGFEFVGQAATLAEAVAELPKSSVDVVLLDLDLGKPGDVDLLSFLGEKHTFQVLLVTGLTRIGEIARLLQAGAGGVFSKSTDAVRLFQAMRQVHQGELWIDQPYLREFIPVVGAALQPPEDVSISETERKILDAVSRGMSNKEIGEKCALSESSVKAALQRLFHRFGVSNRAQLAAASAQILHQSR